MMHAPKYKLCDTCGRNPHRVALRFKSGVVRGWCPSCFKSNLAHAERYGDTAFEGATLVYDLRGTRSKNLCPMPERLLPDPARLDKNGLRVWKRCGHRAELDVNGDCYTCAVKP